MFCIINLFWFEKASSQQELPYMKWQRMNYGEGAQMKFPTQKLVFFQSFKELKQGPNRENWDH
jgi:hypothetical protein